MSDTIRIMQALETASRWHVHQGRKGAAAEPYINHLIDVAGLIARATGGEDPDLVIAALLHDSIEECGVPRELLAEVFGERVAALVEEVTEDKTLVTAERRRLQIEHAAVYSRRGKLLTLADKTSNVRAIATSPAPDWSIRRKLDYVLWARKVVEAIRGTEATIEAEFDRAVATVRDVLLPGDLEISGRWL